MKLIKNYRTDDVLRRSFNELAVNMFGINFEDWYQNGFWNDKYIPYAIVFNNQVLANVSVNIMDIKTNCKVNHYVQLGTVMTKEEYRNKGFIRQLMYEIENDFADFDGMYLFANDAVVDFYPKFGFTAVKEYQYSKAVKIENSATIKYTPMHSKKQWSQLVKAINNSSFRGQFDMINNSDLIMFYISSFMQDSVYYNEKLSAYVVADIEDRRLFIHNIFADGQVELDEIIKSFGCDIEKVTLGFTPLDTEGFECLEINEDDTTTFVKGFNFNKKVMFPTLSHA